MAPRRNFPVAVFDRVTKSSPLAEAKQAAGEPRHGDAAAARSPHL